jgi:hypothetical protein
MAETPKIQIDSDWKAEAQKEKERLTKKEQEKASTAPAAGAGAASSGAAPGPGGERGEPLPPADFRALVGMLAQQAIMGLGVLADRKTGGIIIDLEGSRYAIDLLDILEQKTKGNLSDEEKKELTQILGDLRARFVQIANMVARQMASGAQGGIAGPGGVEPVAASAMPRRGPVVPE